MIEQQTQGLVPERLSDDSLVEDYEPQQHYRTGDMVRSTDPEPVSSYANVFNANDTALSPGRQLAELVYFATHLLDSQSSDSKPTTSERAVLKATLCGLEELMQQIRELFEPSAAIQKPPSGKKKN